jgi:RHS repeat-associated protein
MTLPIVMRRLVVVVAAGVFALPAAVQAQSETVEYYGLDALGSVRVVFNASGVVLGRMDYGPFGEELTASTGVPTNRFAELLRDGESALDYAQARMYQFRTGRFTTVDPVNAGLFEPQLWNRYSYALNSPVSFADPEGLLPQVCTFVASNSNGKLRAELECWQTPEQSRPGQPGGREGGPGNGPGRPGPGPQPGPEQRPGPGPKPSPGPNPNPDPTGQTAQPRRPNPILEGFVRGCGEGLAIVADTANPFGDPFESWGYYDENTPGLETSTFLATTSVLLVDLVSGVRALAWATGNRVIAPRGSALYRMGNNPTARIGYGPWPKTQGRVPRIVIGKKVAGKKDKHIDLRICGL